MITDQENIARLIAFEKDIADRFNRGEIHFPIHLSGGNEEKLILIFRDFNPGDHIYSTWRSHYHALLAGVPEEKVRAKILSGQSMTLCWPEHNFFASAIVSGSFPIAIGAAWEIKRRGGTEKVWIFLGDMASQGGMAYECYNYAKHWKLPVKWVLEDNLKSVCTDTMDAWGGWREFPADYYYRFDLPYPHAGAGKRVQF